LLTAQARAPVKKDIGIRGDRIVFIGKSAALKV
jgi:predicted amidohydrolase YtcJ